MNISVPFESVSVYLVHGPSPAEIIEKYTLITGRPALPPAWTFGLWLTTSFTTNYDEKTVNSFLDGMQERDIPLACFHFDCFWMKAFQWYVRIQVARQSALNIDAGVTSSLTLNSSRTPPVNSGA